MYCIYTAKCAQISDPGFYPNLWSGQDFGAYCTQSMHVLCFYSGAIVQRVWCKGVMETNPRVLNSPSVEPLGGLAGGRTVCLSATSAWACLWCVPGWTRAASCLPWEVTGFMGSQLAPACWDKEMAFSFCFTLMTSRCAEAKLEKVQEGQARLCRGTWASRLWHSWWHSWEWEWDWSPLLTGQCTAGIACCIKIIYVLANRCVHTAQAQWENTWAHAQGAAARAVSQFMGEEGPVQAHLARKQGVLGLHIESPTGLIWPACCHGLCSFIKPGYRVMKGKISSRMHSLLFRSTSGFVNNTPSQTLVSVCSLLLSIFRRKGKLAP